jgi:tRNA A37 threonylcarbamoyltransferase TsaD
VAADNATNAVAELLKTDEAKAHPEEAERLHQLTDALRKAVKSNETTLIELSFIGIEALLDGMNLPLMFGTVITVKLALMAGKVAMAVYHDHKGHHHLHRRMAH